jgi:hypothetical protein
MSDYCYDGQLDSIIRYLDDILGYLKSIDENLKKTIICQENENDSE